MTTPVASLENPFGPASPVITINSQPAAWLESPMTLRPAELQWWTKRMERYTR